MLSDVRSAFNSLLEEFYALNVTEEQLASVRFLRLDPSIAFDNWAFTYCLDFPDKAIGHLKDYLALKWIQDAENPILSGAYEHVQMLLAAKAHAPYQAFKKLQIKKAKLPRGLTEAGRSSFDLVIIFCRKPENLDRSASEMRPHFFQFLADQDLDPVRKPKNSLSYNSRNGTVNMAASTFANLVSRARKIIAKAT